MHMTITPETLEKLAKSRNQAQVTVRYAFDSYL